MKIFENFDSNDTAYATVQLKAHEFQALQNYMHTPAGFNSVKFVHGVYLNYRACGWYRLETTNEFRAIEKLQLAIRVLNKFAAEFEGGTFVPSVKLNVRVRIQKFRPTKAQRMHAHIPVPTPVPVPGQPKPLPTPIGDDDERDAPVVPPVHHSPALSSAAFGALAKHFRERPLSLAIRNHLK